MNKILILLILTTTFSCNHLQKALSDTNTTNCNYHKIYFDIDQIDANGLMGPEDGKVLLSYEFCIPDNDSIIDCIMQIDPEFKVLSSKGRSNCEKGYKLVTGSSGSPNFKSIVCELTRLDYIQEIKRTYNE